MMVLTGMNWLGIESEAYFGVIDAELEGFFYQNILKGICYL
jgi:hypothetical protein